MNGYCHKKTYALRYADFDYKDELKLSALLSLVQESACLSADELGFGYSDLKPKGIGFIIVNTYCELRRPVLLGDEITVETWPLPPRRVFCERDYRVIDGKGEEVALLASRWCLVDLNNFSLLSPDCLGETHTNCPYNPAKSVEVPSWKIPPLRDEKAPCAELRVKNSRCDHYFHANNAYYADFFFDCFSMEELSRRRVGAFQITYGKQAKEDKLLRFYRKDEEAVSRVEARCGEDLLAQCRIVFEENKGEKHE